ncbi:MAG: rRNA maturation RNase YbeY [Candidatus Paceibacterota bacterium]|jgi:rRNA maturation RNase YbeY
MLSVTTDKIKGGKAALGQLARVPYKKLKDAILGKDYTLSVVFVRPEDSQKINNTYRGKNKPTNILSFPLSKNEGEIILNKEQIEREIVTKKVKAKEYLSYLFIHGLLHLKGYAHGSKMEKEEDKFIRKFLSSNNLFSK